MSKGVVMNERAVIDFGGIPWERRPFMLWQQLFDYYRMHGCLLDNMHNILIDLDNCKKLFDDLHENKRICFIWGCDLGHYRTTWIAEKQWKDIGVEVAMRLSGFEWFVFVDVDEKCAVFTAQTALT